MPEFAPRAAVAGLVLAGLGTFLSASLAPTAPDLPAQYLQLLTSALGLFLLLAALVPALRLPVVAVGVLAKLGFVAAWIAVDGSWTSWQPALEVLLLALLSATGAIFLLEARQQSRWEGLPTLRLES
jgi:hypothetical protein